MPLAPRLTAMVNGAVDGAACMSASRMGMLFPTSRVVEFSPAMPAQCAVTIRAVDGSSSGALTLSRRASSTPATHSCASIHARMYAVAAADCGRVCGRFIEASAATCEASSRSSVRALWFESTRTGPSRSKSSRAPASARNVETRRLATPAPRRTTNSGRRRSHIRGESVIRSACAIVPLCEQPWRNPLATSAMTTPPSAEVIARAAARIAGE